VSFILLVFKKMLYAKKDAQKKLPKTTKFSSTEKDQKGSS